MGLVTTNVFGNKLPRGRWYYVMSPYISNCPCGQIIPYGHRSCKGHGAWGKQKTLGKRVCSVCKSDKTYINKTKAGKSYELWLYDKENRPRCKSCYDGQWRKEHVEYRKIYDILYRGRRNHLARIRASVKRGYWVERID